MSSDLRIRTLSEEDLTSRSHKVALNVVRILSIISIFAIFIPAANPVKVSERISKNAALLTTALSPGKLNDAFTRSLIQKWISKATVNEIYIIAVVIMVGIVAIIAGLCCSLGNLKLKNLGLKFISAGSAVGLVATIFVVPVYKKISNAEFAERLKPNFPTGFWFYLIFFAIIFVAALVTLFMVPKEDEEAEFYIQPKYSLFLMILPFIALCFMFSYLPLWGWRYAFFDYSAGLELNLDDFVGFKWFKFLFRNDATRKDIVRVLRNTLAMSFLGILTSWLPMMFAIFINEMNSKWTKKFVQTSTTIPNFISWVLVYVVFFALLSTEGFVNSILGQLGLIDEGKNYLMNNNHMWLKMWAVGTWKSLGWDAIIYISAINGIDPQLYDAADIDGAGRFQKMRYITIPGLIPTFVVLMVLSVGSILSNGMDQYLVFSNPNNKSSIEVLDLYVYNLGLGSGASGNIPLATVVGMFKSVISIILVTFANKLAGRVNDTSVF